LGGANLQAIGVEIFYLADDSIGRGEVSYRSESQVIKVYSESDGRGVFETWGN
jgi:hypothetical protein